jgi:hypothetical protein
MRNDVKKLILVFLGLIFLGPGYRASADVIHGKITAVTQVGNGSEPSGSLPVRLEDNWGILLQEERDFLRGVEIQVNLPEEAGLYTGTYAVFVYKKVSPPPDKSRTSYQGSLLFFKVIEERRRLFLQLPLESLTGFTAAPDTYLHRTPLSAADFPLVFAILPIMKGIPEQAARALFHAEVRPLFKNVGKLIISVAGDEDGSELQDVTLYIDDKARPFSAGGILLEPGIRRIRIEKPGYADFSAALGIDRGKTALMEAVFLNRSSSLRINAPMGARAFLDGQAIAAEGTEIPVESGEHNLSVKLGDYQINKRFRVEAGKTYSASVFLDILINED